MSDDEGAGSEGLTASSQPPAASGQRGVEAPSGHHIILIGLPGAGKTTLGRALARALGWSFVDLDAEIVRRAGRPITAIFKSRGESGFRALEREATRHLQGAAASVIAPGGGWVTVPETVALLRPPSRLVYLEVSPGTAAYRLRRSAHSRPLLRQDPRGALERLYEARRMAYEGADLALNTEVLDRQQVIDRIVALVSDPQGA